jgi:hypothetical protein
MAVAVPSVPFTAAGGGIGIAETGKPAPHPTTGPAECAALPATSHAAAKAMASTLLKTTRKGVIACLLSQQIGSTL